MNENIPESAKMKFSQSLLSSVCVAMAMTLSACAVSTNTSSEAAAIDVAPLTLDLKAGQVLQFALVKSREGEAAQAVRARYFQTAIPYAESLGDEYLGNLNIKQTMIGKNKPAGIALYAFPNAAAQAKFQASPDWADYQKMRREGWEELHVLSTTVQKDMTLTFDPSKDYTLAVGWTKPGTSTDYNRYLDGIEPDFDEIGATYVARFEGLTLQSQTDDASDPTHLTLVEWSDGPNLPGLQATEGYKANSKYFQAAISRFDFYWITTTGTP